MKRTILLLAAILLICTGCGETVYENPEAMVHLVQRGMAVPDGAVLDVRYIDQYTKGEEALLWYSVDVGEEDVTYVPVRCSLTKDGGYIFGQKHNAVERGKAIVFYMWGNDYSFCIGNPDCRMIRYTDYTGEHEAAIEEGTHPVLVQTTGTPVEYFFYDADGNEIK